MHKEAVAIRGDIGDPDGEANSLNNLSNAYVKIGELERGRECFERSLKIHRVGGNLRMLVSTLKNLGMVSRKTGDHEAALGYLNESREIASRIHDVLGEASTLGE